MLKQDQIKLSDSEKKWIKLIKNHYKDRYKIKADNWINCLRPMFEELYGYNSLEYQTEFLNCIFYVLLDIYMKIKIDGSGSNLQIKTIFKATFEKSIRRDYETPVERAIAELCGQIQSNVVVQKGVPRYSLELIE